MDANEDALARAMNEAWGRHTDAVQRGASARVLSELRLAALRAERALYADCPGEADAEQVQNLGFEIEDEEKYLASLTQRTE